MAKATKTEEAAKVQPEAEVSPFGKHRYEEWKVEITQGENKEPKAEKLKIARPCVKISEDHAAVLNNAVLYGSNKYGVMYFKPE